jgi:hypothetical protein
MLVHSGVQLAHQVLLLEFVVFHLLLSVFHLPLVLVLVGVVVLGPERRLRVEKHLLLVDGTVQQQ